MAKRGARTRATTPPTSFTNTLTGRTVLAADGVWNNMVTMGVLRSAGFVLAEDPAAPNHALRRALGQAVLQDPPAWGRRFAQALASDANITTDTPSDQTVLDTISAWWNHFAGVDT